MKSKMLWLPGSAPLMMLEKATGVCGGVLDYDIGGYSLVCVGLLSEVQ